MSHFLNIAKKYLTSFSLYRNFRRLWIPNNSPIGKDLSFVDALRNTMSIIMTFEHAVFLHFAPVANPESVEYLLSTRIFLFSMHLVACIEIFFLMTGLMLFIKFDKGQFITERSSFFECLKVFGRLMISRYLR